MLTEDNLPSGTEVAYALVCEAKLWFFSHQIRMEDSSDVVLQGKDLHENSYNKKQKNLQLGNSVAIDFFEPGAVPVIREIKKSKSLSDVHKIQLQYYMWYAKEIIGIWPLSGIISYPLLRKNEPVELLPDDENRLSDIAKRIAEIKSLALPPVQKRSKFCTKCAYFEWCWV